MLRHERRFPSPTGPVRIERVLGAIGVLALAWAVGLPCAVAESSSPRFTLRQGLADSGTVEPSFGSRYRLEASVGQETTIGTSSSPRYILQSGLWGFVGSGLVPVLLSVERNASTPEHVDLSWSGNNAPYDVYQATDCSNVFAAYYDSTGANSYVDIAPPGESLTCFSVLATAPGPVPEPSPPPIH